MTFHYMYYLQNHTVHQQLNSAFKDLLFDSCFLLLLCINHEWSLVRFCFKRYFECLVSELLRLKFRKSRCICAVLDILFWRL